MKLQRELVFSCLLCLSAASVIRKNETLTETTHSHPASSEIPLNTTAKTSKEPPQLRINSQSKKKLPKPTTTNSKEAKSSLLEFLLVPNNLLVKKYIDHDALLSLVPKNISAQDKKRIKDGILIYAKSPESEEVEGSEERSTTEPKSNKRATKNRSLLSVSSSSAENSDSEGSNNEEQSEVAVRDLTATLKNISESIEEYFGEETSEKRGEKGSKSKTKNSTGELNRSLLEDLNNENDKPEDESQSTLEKFFDVIRNYLQKIQSDIDDEEDKKTLVVQRIQGKNLEDSQSTGLFFAQNLNRNSSKQPKSSENRKTTPKQTSKSPSAQSEVQERIVTIEESSNSQKNKTRNLQPKKSKNKQGEEKPARPTNKKEDTTENDSFENTKGQNETSVKDALQLFKRFLEYAETEYSEEAEEDTSDEEEENVNLNRSLRSSEGLEKKNEERQVQITKRTRIIKLSSEEDEESTLDETAEEESSRALFSAETSKTKKSSSKTKKSESSLELFNKNLKHFNCCSILEPGNKTNETDDLDGDEEDPELLERYFRSLRSISSSVETKTTEDSEVVQKLVKNLLRAFASGENSSLHLNINGTSIKAKKGILKKILLILKCCAKTQEGESTESTVRFGLQNIESSEVGERLVRNLRENTHSEKENPSLMKPPVAEVSEASNGAHNSSTKALFRLNFANIAQSLLPKAKPTVEKPSEPHRPERSGPTTEEPTLLISIIDSLSNIEKIPSISSTATKKGSTKRPASVSTTKAPAKPKAAKSAVQPRINPSNIQKSKSNDTNSNKQEAIEIRSLPSNIKYDVAAPRFLISSSIKAGIKFVAKRIKIFVDAIFEKLLSMNLSPLIGYFLKGLLVIKVTIIGGIVIMVGIRVIDFSLYVAEQIMDALPVSDRLVITAKLRKLMSTVLDHLLNFITDIDYVHAGELGYNMLRKLFKMVVQKHKELDVSLSI